MYENIKNPSMPNDMTYASLEDLCMSDPTPDAFERMMSGGFQMGPGMGHAQSAGDMDYSHEPSSPMADMAEDAQDPNEPQEDMMETIGAI